jgi:hypothetical protein
MRLLVRNAPLPWTCGVCRAPATLACCAHEDDGGPFVCAAHERLRVHGIGSWHLPDGHRHRDTA